MGYTNYFAYDPASAQFVERWTTMVEDAQRLCETVVARGVAIAGGHGDGQPEFTQERIWLNGGRAGDLGHETFSITARPWRDWLEPDGGWPEDAAGGWAEREAARFERDGFIWSCCKTARKPYDVLVGAILLRCKQLAPEAFAIGSDGRWETEWLHSASYWDAGCTRSDLSARKLVAELFGTDTIARTAVLTDTSDGPPSVHMRRLESGTSR
jgi:hypothetical protein